MGVRIKLLRASNVAKVEERALQAQLSHVREELGMVASPHLAGCSSGQPRIGEVGVERDGNIWLDEGGVDDGYNATTNFFDCLRGVGGWAALDCILCRQLCAGPVGGFQTGSQLSVGVLNTIFSAVDTPAHTHLLHDLESWQGFHWEGGVTEALGVSALCPAPATHFVFVHAQKGGGAVVLDPMAPGGMAEGVGESLAGVLNKLGVDAACVRTSWRAFAQLCVGGEEREDELIPELQLNTSSSMDCAAWSLYMALTALCKYRPGGEELARKALDCLHLMQGGTGSFRWPVVQMYYSARLRGGWLQGGGAGGVGRGRGVFAQPATQDGQDRAAAAQDGVDGPHDAQGGGDAARDVDQVAGQDGAAEAAGQDGAAEAAAQGDAAGGGSTSTQVVQQTPHSPSPAKKRSKVSATGAAQVQHRCSTGAAQVFESDDGS